MYGCRIKDIYWFMIATVLYSRASSFSPISTYTNIRKFAKRTQLMQKIAMASTTTSSSIAPVNNKVIVLAGATSAGKSAVSLELCKHLDAEIVIADSVQVYTGLDIGANKPTLADQQIVPHHLIDIAHPSQQMSTGDFSQKASEIIFDILRRNKVPIVVGGSTMWIQWLVHGQPDAPKASEEALRKTSELIDELEKEKKWDEAFEIMQSHDPVRAAKLCRNDWYRMRRYLEIAIDLTLGAASSSSSDDEDNKNKVTLTGSRTKLLDSLDVRCYFLTESRESLYHTIDNRCEQMLYAGLLQETAALIAKGSLAPEFSISKSIGYRQAIEYFSKVGWKLEDMDAFSQFFSDFATATRNYAKRQMMWYRKDKLFLFLQIFRNEPVQGNPYDVVAQELLHWFNSEKTEFDEVLQRQLLIAEYASLYIKKGNVYVEHDCKDAAEFEVLQWLLETNRIKLSGLNKIPGSSYNDWLARNSKFHNFEVKDPKAQYTAFDYEVRVGEVGDKKKKMRFFSSNSLKSNLGRFASIVNTADTCRADLWLSHKVTMEKFQEWKD